MWFLLPNAIGFLVFTLLPVLAAFLLSFTQWDAVESWRGIHWTGLGNYREILGLVRTPQGLQASDEQFWTTMYNTVFLMLGIPLGMALSFFTALLMNQRLRGITLYRVVFFLPTVCSAVAVAMVWRWVYDADWGLLNQSLRMVGVANPPGWLLDPSWAKPALILMGLWMGVGGYNCVLYLAGLQNIPPELYEAADIDGANAWRKFWNITIPMLTPTIFFNMLMSIIGSFQVFTQVYIMTDGGPNNATLTMVLYLYRRGFINLRFGYASAIAWILFFIILFFTMLVVRSSAAWVYYEGELRK